MRRPAGPAGELLQGEDAPGAPDSCRRPPLLVPSEGCGAVVDRVTVIDDPRISELLDPFLEVLLLGREDGEMLRRAQPGEQVRRDLQGEGGAFW